LIVSLPIASLTHPSKPIDAACLPVEDGDTAWTRAASAASQAVLEVEQHLSRPSVIIGELNASVA